MDKFKKSEFARVCGISQAAVSMLLKRGNIVANKKGEIDVTNVKNKLYVQTRIANGDQYDLNGVIGNNPVVKAKANKQAAPTNSKADGDFAEMQKKKLLLETQKLEKAVELDELKIAKISGTLIPTDAVTHLFVNSVITMKAVYLQSIENITAVFSKQLNLTHEEVIQIKKEIRGVIDTLQGEMKEQLLNGVDEIVNDYSEVRGRGERK